MWGYPTLSEDQKIAAENFIEAGSPITNDNDGRSLIVTDCRTIEEQIFQGHFQGHFQQHFPRLCRLGSIVSRKVYSSAPSWQVFYVIIFKGFESFPSMAIGKVV